MLNKLILIGRVGKEPEIKTTDNSNKVAKINLATSEKYKNKSGEVVEQTEWHSISVWGKLADVVEKYVKKGDLLSVVGKVTYRKYENDGITKYFTEVIANEIKMLGGNKIQTDAQEAKDEATPPPAGEDDLPF